MKKIIVLIILFILTPQSIKAEDKSIELRATRYSYSPNVIHVKKGDKVTIKLISTDVTHGFFLDGYDLNLFAHPGKPEQITFKAEKSGKFSFRCSRTCGEFHPYMIGYLRVEPNITLHAGISLIAIVGLGSLLILLLRKQHPQKKEKLLGIIPLNWRFELTKFKVVRALLKSRWFPFALIIINLFMFSIILVAGFTGGFSAGNYNFGIMLVWILWYSLLMLFLVPFGGRIWCMTCPFPLFGEWLQRGKLLKRGGKKSRGLSKKWPKELRNLWPLTILFFVTTFFSAFFTVRPLATFILLAAIIGSAIILSLIYEKRTFCLYFCPVSGFQGLYSNFATSEVRVKNPEICKKHTPKTCFVGNEKGYGCPWNELPYNMNRNTNCGLCMECFKTCPYDNMAFNLRPPGVDLLEKPKRTGASRAAPALDEAFKGFTMLGIMFVFYLTMQGPYGTFKDMVRALPIGGYLVFILGHAVVSFLLVPGIFLLFAFISKIASKSKDVTLRMVFSDFSCLFIPIGLAAWAAFSVGIILPNGSYLIHVFSDPFAWGWDLFGTANFPWTPFQTGLMPYAQVLCLTIGLLFSLDYGYKIARRIYSEDKAIYRGWFPIVLFLIGIYSALVWLFVG